MVLPEKSTGQKPLTDEELNRLRRFLRAFPDENAADQAVELFETYRAVGHLGKVALGILKILAVIAGGIIAWTHLRGFWTGKGGM